MALRMRDLPARDRKITVLPGGGILEGRPIVIYCRACEAEYSARQGDYWAADPDAVMLCGACGADALILTQPRIVRASLSSTDAERVTR